MASIQYVVSATDAASAVFAKIGMSADGLDKQLEDLSKRIATPEVDLKDAKFTLGVLNAAKRLDKLNAMVADPSVEVETGKAQLEILRITAMLDRLDAKRVDVKVDVDRSVLSRLGGLVRGGGGLGGIAGTAGGALAIGAAIGPALVGLAQITSALAAAGAGVAAFGALSIPQFTAVSDALSQIKTDMDAYERATTKASKSLALKHIRQDWADLTGPQAAAVHGIQSLQAEFGKLSAKLAPITFKVLNEGLKIAGQLLPSLLPFARAAGNAIDGLLKSFSRFTQTAGFKSFLAQLQALSGPAITALGQGMGKIAVAVGKLILVSASPNSIKVLSGLLDVLAGSINVLTFVIGRASGKIVEWKNDFADIDHVISGFYTADRARNRAWAHDVAAGFDTVRHTIATWGHDTAVTFDGVRHDIATIGHDIARAFDDVRRVFATIGHDIADTFDRVRHFQGQFDAFGKDIQLVRHWITDAFDAIRHGGAIMFDALRHLIAAAWDSIRHDTAAKLDGFRHDIAAAFDAIRHGIAAAWDAIWSNSNSQAQHGVSGIVSWFRSLPGRVIGALRGLGHSLYAFGHAALDEFLNGFKNIAGAIVSWAKNFFGGLVKSIGRFLGMSPPHPGSAFYDLGANMMAHLEAGIKSRAAHVRSAAVGAAGSGVQRWAGLVKQALAMEGLSPGLLGNVLYQIQTESGGNPNAINLNDINAQMGDPSRGLLQTIQSTFSAYHWPGTSYNIYDPLANIAAALNYARHVYGPSLMSGGMGIGSGHGYALGSWNVPYTGPAVVHQGEMIIPAGAAAAVRAGGGGNTYVTVNVKVGHGTSPRQAAKEIADILNQGATSGIQLRRSIVSANG